MIEKLKTKDRIKGEFAIIVIPEAENDYSEEDTDSQAEGSAEESC